MDASTKSRLERLLDDLAEIEDRHSTFFGFGIFEPKDGTETPPRRSWDALNMRLNQGRSRESIPLQPEPWLDPAINNKCCIRWWGDRSCVASFQPWAVRFVRLLARDEAFSDLARNADCHECLLALCKYAAISDRLKDNVEVVELGDGRFFDVKDWGIRFVRTVAWHFLGGPVARLHVNEDTDAVTVDGHTYFPDLACVRVLALLQGTGGVPITRRRLQEIEEKRYGATATLQDGKRLDRVIDDVRTKLKIPVQSSHEGYWLPPEYLAG